jgi:hypothetical protein
MSQDWPGQQVGTARSMQPQQPAAPQGNQPRPVSSRVIGGPPLPKEPPQPTPVRPYDVQQDLVNNEQSLRKEFYSLPAVKEYQVAVRTYANSLQAGDDASGDQSLIVAYAKMLDPASVVREGEAAAVAGTDSTIGRNIARLGKELGLEAGGTLSPDIRAKIRREMRTLAENYGAAYGMERGQFEKLATSYGFDPTRIVGEDFATPYRKTIDEYWARQEQNNAPDAPAGVPADGASLQELGGDTTQTYGRDEFGAPLIAIKDGVAYGVMQGRLSDAEPTYVRFDSQYADALNSDAVDLYAKIQADQAQLGEGGGMDVAKAGITLGLSDEAAGVGNAIAGALQGDFNVSENFQRGAAAEQFRIDQGRESLGAAAIPVELLGSGGALRAAGAFGQLRQGVQSVRNAGLPVNRANVQNALVRRSTAEGAGVGALAGAAQGDTLEERGGNALLGGLAGGAIGNVGTRIGNAVSNRTPNNTPPTGGRGVQIAADTLGIQVTPAVTGGTATRMLTSGARQGFVSARPIERAVDRMEAQGMAARERIADNTGQVLDAEDAGNLIRRAGEVYSQRTAETGGKLYDRVERLGGGQKFALTDGVAEADKWLADVGRSVQGTEGTIYKQIKALRDKMAGRQFDVMSIPRTRDEFRALLQETGLRGSTLETAVKQILDKAEGDILNGLRQSGNDRAVGAFKTATDYWRKRVETIDEFFSPILGKNAPKSGEQVVTALERLANPQTGNASQLVGILKAMPPKEAASVRATLINRMGRASAGSANNTDNATFSFETFLTNWNNMSPRAKAAAFPPETRKALNDLVTVSEAVKQSGASANRSNTAGALTVQGVISLGAFVDPLSTAAATGGQYVVGRLLASPKFARLLAGAPRNASPQARKAFDAQLTKLAAAEPTIAREIGLYQRALAANDNPASRLAAEEQQPNEPQ